MIKTSHTDVDPANIKIINKNFSNNKKNPKIAKSSWIKVLTPKLNVKEKTIPLELFN